MSGATGARPTGSRATSTTSSPATPAILDSAKDPVKLRRYSSVLALDNAGLSSETTLYRAAGVNAKTAAGSEQLLRNLYVLDVVSAWTSNRLHRLVKQGKRYLVDTGLATDAAGITAPVVLGDPALLGRYFDTFATAQLPNCGPRSR